MMSPGIPDINNLGWTMGSIGGVRPGWTGFLRRQGADYLAWVAANRVLETKFEALASALWTLLLEEIRTPEDARAVWRATPAVLIRCNEQATYALPKAAAAYAWLHLLDRYARTWRALERLVAAGCLPLTKHGVRALDVGTGPGPSAFAVHDFYAAMTEFAAQTGNVQWRQPASITCVEFDINTNRLRHYLAEIMFEQSEQQSRGVLAMCHALTDFRAIVPRAERKRLQKEIRWAEDEYFDEVANEWTSDLRYSPDEANDMAQSLHRYRLIVFSNFLTTVGVVTSFEPNLVDILADAQPGSVVMVLGGKEKSYPDVYGYVDHLAKPAGFELEVAGEHVSSADSVVANRIYAEGAKICARLQSLTPDTSEETQRVRSHFTESRQAAPSSHLWAYRKTQPALNS
jgi:hypothetical protein